MESVPTLFVRIDGKIRGPLLAHDLTSLRQAGLITRSTEVATTSDGPWVPLGESEPGWTIVSAASTRFERVNTNEGPPIVLADLIASANRVPIRPAEIASSREVLSAPHDVASLLKLNLDTDRRHGWFALAPIAQRRSKRRTDYFLLLLFIAVAITVVLLVESYVAVQVQVLAARMPDRFWPILNDVLFHSPIFAWGLAAFAFYAISLGWLMFFVMEDY